MRYYWSYDSNGTLRKPGSIEISEQALAVMNGRICNFEVGNVGDWVLGAIPYLLQNNKKEMTNCGAILLSVELTHMGETDMLVKGYEFQLLGLDASIRAFNASKAYIEKARADANEAAIKKGQQQKPDF